MEPRPLILACEDEERIVDLLRALTEPLGVDLVAAPDGASALAQLAVRRPALMTLDLVLPNLDGFGVLERIRQRRDLDDMPIIVISAICDAQTVRRAYTMGVVDFVRCRYPLPDGFADPELEYQTKDMPDPWHDLAPVTEVAALVGIDERQVEYLLVGQRAQRVDGRAEPQLDPVGQARLLPVLPGHRGPLLADVATEQVSPGGQATSNADRGVAGEGADLDGGDGPGQLGQQRHERALLGRDGQAHLGREQLHRLVRQLAQDRVRRAGVRGEVRVEMEADLLGTLRHGITLARPAPQRSADVRRRPPRRPCLSAAVRSEPPPTVPAGSRYGSPCP